jgi:hypothetical protein
MPDKGYRSAEIKSNPKGQGSFTVKTTAKPIALNAPSGKLLLLQADPDNTGSIWVGDENVSTASGPRYVAGTNITIDGKADYSIDLNNWYVISDVANQVIHYMIIGDSDR